MNDTTQPQPSGVYPPRLVQHLNINRWNLKMTKEKNHTIISIDADKATDKFDIHS